jgi:hypothetical protein
MRKSSGVATKAGIGNADYFCSLTVDVQALTVDDQVIFHVICPGVHVI